MDKLIRMLTIGLLGLLLLSAGPRILPAAEEVAAAKEAPNPFKQLPAREENIAAKGRHVLDHARDTWEGYFNIVPDELKGFEPDTLEKVKADPIFHVDRKIQCNIYMGKQGSFYRPFTSPFSKDIHANFTGWAYGAEIWNKDVRADVHPLFYIDRRSKDLVDKIAALPEYTPLHVWVIVRSASDNAAYIEVLKAEVIPESPLTEAALRHLELGAIELNKKHYDLAAQALEGALKLELAVNVEAKVYGMLGKAYYEQRLFTAARNALVEAILRNGSEVNNLLLLSRTDLRLNKAGEAREAGERLVALDPANAAGHAELGLALALKGDSRAGYKELDIAQKLAHNLLPEANRNRAVLLAREGKLEQACDELKQAIITRPTDVDFKLELGDLEIALGKLDLARTEFTQARELAPQRPETHYKLALVVKKQADAAKKEGKEDEAKKLYEEALGYAKTATSKDDQFAPAFGLEAELLRAVKPKKGPPVIEPEEGSKDAEPPPPPPPPPAPKKP